MERAKAIREVQEHIECMARLHLVLGLYQSEGFRKSKENAARLIREHNLDARKDLNPQTGMLYRRYFD